MFNLFDNRKVKRIETLPRGNAFIYLWHRLLCLAGSISDERRVYLSRDIPYTRQTLTRQLQQPLSIVQQAPEVFARFGMIDQSDGSLRLINRQTYQDSESLERIREQAGERVARYHQNKKSVTAHCRVTVTSP